MCNELPLAAHESKKMMSSYFAARYFGMRSTVAKACSDLDGVGRTDAFD